MALPLSPFRPVAGPLLVAVACGLELAGQHLGVPGPGLPGIWVGLLLAARLLGGPMLLPWVAAAAAAALLLADGGAAWRSDLGLAAALAVATAAVARGLEATAGGARFLDAPAGVGRFLLFAGLLAPVAVALAEAGLLAASGQATSFELVGRWAIALAFDELLVAPAVVALALEGRRALAWLRGAPWEALAIGLLSLAVLELALGMQLPVQPALFGLMLWLELRARAAGSLPMGCAYGLVLGYATARGFGPLAVQATSDLTLEAYELRVVFQLSVFLVLHALLVANDRHLASLQQRNEELQALTELKARYAEDLEADVLVRTEEARRARAAAEVANAAKTSFLARMSHEIRTPVTALKGFAELMGDPDLPDARRLRYADAMRRNSEHLGALVDDVLDLTRMEAGKLVVERVPFALPALLADVERLWSDRAREKGLAFSLRREGALPVPLEGDPARLRQILLALVGNAVKFTSSGSVQVELGVDLDGILRARVTDTGIGMTPEQVERLYQPFEQADVSMTRRFGGAGLGLSIAQSLIQAMGGELEVRTAPHAGSTFTLRLPMALPAGAAWVLAAPEPAPRQERPLAGRVLMAEDGPDNQLLFQALLEAAGLTLTLVADGRAAVDAVLAASEAYEPFDLVLMDMQMPVLDGYSATRALRAAGYGGPIVALTAHAMAGERERCLAAGCDDYLSKPIDRPTLLAAVARYLPDAPVALDFGDLDLDDLVAMFKDTLPGRLGALEAAAAACDHEALQRLSHQLKGAAGSYGFGEVTAAAEAVNQAARARAVGRELAEPLAALERSCRHALGEPA